MKIIEYINKEKIKNTFAYNMVNNGNIYSYEDNKKISGFFVQDGPYLYVNFSKNMSGDNKKKACNDLSDTIIKNNIKDYTCDDYTSKIINEKSNIDHEDKECYIAFLNKKLEKKHSNYEFEVPSNTDIKEMKQLHLEIFNGNLNLSEEDLNRYLILKEKNKIIFMCSCTTLKTEVSMIVGVCTKEEYRNKKIAQEGVYKLCYNMQQNNIIPVLFYDNPSAAHIYKKIGFEDIDSKYYVKKVKFI